MARKNGESGSHISLGLFSMYLQIACTGHLVVSSIGKTLGLKGRKWLELPLLVFVSLSFDILNRDISLISDDC